MCAGRYPVDCYAERVERRSICSSSARLCMALAIRTQAHPLTDDGEQRRETQRLRGLDYAATAGAFPRFALVGRPKTSGRITAAGTPVSSSISKTHLAGTRSHLNTA